MSRGMKGTCEGSRLSLGRGMLLSVATVLTEEEHSILRDPGDPLKVAISWEVMEGCFPAVDVAVTVVSKSTPSLLQVSDSGA